MPLLLNNTTNEITNSGSNEDVLVTPTGTGDLVLDGLKWPQADGTNTQVLSTNGTGQLVFSNGGGLSNVVEDTTPQLGGFLDLNGNYLEDNCLEYRGADPIESGKITKVKWFHVEELSTGTTFVNLVDLDGGEITIPASTAWTYQADIIGSDNNSAKVYSASFRGSFSRDAADTRVLTVEETLHETESSWDAEITSAATGLLRIRAHGASIENVRWAAVVRVIEIDNSA